MFEFYAKIVADGGLIASFIDGIYLGDGAVPPTIFVQDNKNNTPPPAGDRRVFQLYYRGKTPLSGDNVFVLGAIGIAITPITIVEKQSFWSYRLLA